jgi:Holliday junction resolvase RusA-like endonuclease
VATENYVDRLSEPESVTVYVKIPAPELAANSRAHWRTKHRAFQEAKRSTHILASAECNLRPQWRHAISRITWYSATAMHPDPDNALHALKAAFDGIVAAGILVDDRGLRHEPITFRKDFQNPRVEITIICEEE